MPAITISSSDWTAPPSASKSRLITEDILAQMRSGDLKPGDRLPGIGRLRKRYQASQSVVESAIAWLASNGAISVSERRGCFILSKPAPATDAMPAPTDAGRGSVRRHLEFYSRPRAEQRSLSIYLTEIFPENLAIWNEELDALKSRLGLDDLRVSTCRDGHIQDLWGTDRFDLALLDHRVLHALGTDAFLDLDATHAGLSPGDYIPIVREALERGERLHGVPFSVVLQHLFVNDRLESAIGTSLAADASFRDLLLASRAAQPALRGEGRQALRIVGRLVEVLIADGALRCDVAGRVTFDEDAALGIARALAGSGLEGVGRQDDVQEFAAGRLVYLLHCTYQTLDFAERADFPWSVRCAPAVAGASEPASLMLFAVNRDAGLVSEALEVLRHFSTPEVQRRFATVGGNLPAVAAAADGATLAQHPIGAAGLQQQLAHSTLLWPMRTRRALTRHLDLHREEFALTAGTMTPEQVMARMRLGLARVAADT